VRRSEVGMLTMTWKVAPAQWSLRLAEGCSWTVSQERINWNEGLEAFLSSSSVLMGIVMTVLKV
jgi:hypothetical protein